MRPVELTLSNITSFTDSDGTVVDFRDTDVFALTGSTGAGKTSLLDAISFALYGRIPRLKGNEIAPLLSTRATTGKVVFVFDVNGVRYRAFRELRRSARGTVSIKEAVVETLDDGGNPLSRIAEDTDTASEVISALIGLTFPQFQQVCMLPQGGYDRLLTSQPKDRRRLLLDLLQYGPIEDIRARAQMEASTAKALEEQVETQVHDHGEVTEDQVAAAEARKDTLAGLVADLRADDDAYTRLKDGLADLAAGRDQAVQYRTDLTEAAAGAPESLTGLLESLTGTDTAVTQAQQVLEQAEEDAEKARSELDSLGPDTVRRAVAAHQAAADAAAAAATAEESIGGLTDQVTAAAEALGPAEQAASDAGRALREAERANGVFHAARDLGPGDTCPVCETELTDSPSVAETDISPFEKADRDARKAHEAARAAHTKAVTTHSNATRHAKDLRDKAQTARTDADAIMTEPQATAAHARLADLEKLAKESDQAARTAREKLAAATRRRQQLDPQVADATRHLDALAAKVGADHTNDPLPQRWAALAAWATKRTADAHTAVEEAETALRTATEAIKTAANAMVARLTDAGLEHTSGVRPVEIAVREAEAARHGHAVLVDRAAKHAGLTAELTQLRERRQVQAEIARLCRSNNFQDWLVDEALADLCDSATDRLLELSGGRYELVVAKGGHISVIDLHQAGEERLSRTLSGGETFLVSLALALTVADQISARAQSPVHVHSLFLDEGFGTLDPHHLDQAIAVLEKLAEEDRTVGVITHVKDLADRMPVRYVVKSTRETGGSAEVERIEGVMA